MKKLLTLLMLPIIAFGQNTQTQVNATQVNTSTKVNVVNERDLVLSEKSTKVFTEFPDDMSMYTDILIVDAIIYVPAKTNKAYMDGVIKDVTLPARFGSAPGAISNILSSTIFNIQDPFAINKKMWRKNPKFLQDVKNASYLHLYVRQSQGKGDDINTSFMLRDYNRKLIYRATGVNVTIEEILEPLFNF